MGKYVAKAAKLAAVVVFGVAAVNGHISDWDLVPLGLGLHFGAKYVENL